MAYTFKGQKELMTANARKANSKMRPDGFVYILKMKGFNIYKIGVSSNPKRRIIDIDSANPFGVDLMFQEFFKNVYEMEECIHDSFSKNLLRKEWFKIHPDDIAIMINQLKDLSKEGVYLIRK